MSIFPLPQFEADLTEALSAEDKATYDALKAPKTLVVRFGSMKLVGEFPYQGTVKPGCGSKLVVRTFRGTELGEMLTSTCPNSGCSKSVSRKEMLQYIDNSGGRDYPFFTDGKVLRIATTQDLEAQSRLEQSRHAMRLHARSIAERLRLHCKIVDVEPILGNETVTVFYLSEERIELRDLTRELSLAFRTRVELRHVGARDEARLTADYEKCGQYCCCKNFLKVLKPVSMKSAKVQKATLDPVKISGRCGRLMCCLRYEDETYDDLRKRLPRKKSRVGTPEGDGLVIDSQILTQLVLVELDDVGTDGKIRQVAVPVENLTPPTNQAAPPRPAFDPAPPPRARGRAPGAPPA
ncbi:MAG: regulatory iron-sulfur-containing complex subunit RicT, partial [Planctomycetota bacterium]|nr:regulatory iron-sulfur-containing complex subunit RicT [Planctomycetota bacterium]